MPKEYIKTALHVSDNEAELIVNKALSGGEVSKKTELLDWTKNRLIPNCVFIDENEYAMMCVDALKILETTAPTDYGSSRQRDKGQLWADMTRGYLGEIAIVKFLKEKFDIDCTLGHEQGSIKNYLPTDIYKIRKRGEKLFRPPKLHISIKTSKWSGIWLDLPGDQFNHSDIHVFVKVGTGRDHLFAFFKHISVFKDKVLSKGVEVGSLTKKEAQELFDKLPSFTSIPAYICGFAKKDAEYVDLSYSGKKGRKHYTIRSWSGRIRSGDIDRIKKTENVSGDVKFEGIGNFSHDSGYLFNIGTLLWKYKDWAEVVNRM